LIRSCDCEAFAFHHSRHLSICNTACKQVIASSWSKISQNKLQLIWSEKENFQPHALQNEFQQFSSMSDKIIPSLHTLPIDIVYRILNNLDDLTIFCSMRNVCTRINAIMDIYHRYQVNFFFLSEFLVFIIFETSFNSIFAMISVLDLEL
jgi:hypothetical protein